MEHIWAPWRIEYIRMAKPKGCILCSFPKKHKDEQNCILFRGKKNFVIMNSFPYNPGHIMVAPYRHVADLDALAKEELHEHSDVVARCIKILRDAFSPMGFNIGTNMGRVAGAGIADHVHTHIVPRWQGDSNFMPIIGHARVIPEAVADTYRLLRDRF